MTDKRRYLRFTIPNRLEHWLLTLSFTVLAITGLVQKYSSVGLSQSLIELMGGIETVRVIHRAAAILMMVEVVYHLGVVGYRMFVRRTRLTMLPGMHDVRAALQAVQHNLGLGADRPREGRYTFAEKAEYWALVWGTLIMVVTGFLLWNPIASAKFLPGQFIPAAKIAHGGEAVLATLAIFVWHFYGVHVKIFNKSIFTGFLTKEEMEEEHSVELAEIEAGVTDRPVSQPVLKKRRRSYAVVFGIVAAVMLVGIFWFVTFEETAITTVPPVEDVLVFAPLTATPFPTPLPTSTPKPTSTPQPTSTPEPTLEPGAPTSEPEAPAPEPAVSWQDGVADLFQQECGACHGEANALGGLDLSSYQSALVSGNSGPAIQPGDPDASGLVILLAEGGHPGQLDEDGLSLIRQWIDGGALESPVSESGAPAAEAAVPEVRVTWQEDLGDLFVEKCGACHSEASALGGLDLSNYEATLAGGNSGPGVQAGDPDGSALVDLQAEGGHPGQFSDQELELVRQWIADGAPGE